MKQVAVRRGLLAVASGLAVCAAVWVAWPVPEAVNTPSLEDSRTEDRQIAAAAFRALEKVAAGRQNASSPFDRVRAVDPHAPTHRAGPTLSREWQATRDQIREVTEVRWELPEGQPDPDALAEYRARTRERRQLLDAMETELIDYIQMEPDPYSRADAEVTLARLYLAQAETFSNTWIPDHFPERRAERMAERLGNRTVIARDKARMVYGLAQTHAQPWPNDPLQERIGALGDWLDE